MVKKWIGPDEVGGIIEKFEEAMESLKGLRRWMLDPGPKTIELNFDNANTLATKLVDWSAKAKLRHRKLQLDSSADSERSATEKRRGGNKNAKKSD